MSSEGKEAIKNGRTSERTSPLSSSASNNNNKQGSIADLTPETSDDDFREY
jgi:hypothetical protein